MKRAIIVSISSDIGIALAEKWRKMGWEVTGTYRTYSPAMEALEDCNVNLIHCDLSDITSIKTACSHMQEKWDILVLGAGDLEPIGNFQAVHFDDWEKGIHVNFIQQMRIVHELLPFRNLEGDNEPCVQFFAGGGTNNAVLHYSSYTISKIALIKMCELLDAEISDTRFVIIGPGCVKTKIHEPTLRLGSSAAGDNYERTKQRLERDECTPMDKVIDVCHYLATTECVAVTGRNFSVVDDFSDIAALEKELAIDTDMYKLRRNKNAWSKACSR